MNKILYIATSDIHISTFHIPYLKMIKSEGHELHLIVENRGNLVFPFVDKTIHLIFPRSIFRFQNLKAYNRLKMIIDSGNYNLIHCHTPIPSMLTRIASIKARKKGVKVLYTAHGFHFFKGAAYKYWLLYFTAEWFLSFFTDSIITMNKEDYQLAKSNLKSNGVYYIKGIGVDSGKFLMREPEERIMIREKLGFTKDDFILTYVAEFIHRKNHKFIIECIPELQKSIPELKVLLIGKGILFDKCKNDVLNLGLSNCIKFFGFRNDVDLFASITDIGVSSSRQEGLPIGLAEQMCCSVPIVATTERGHKELIDEGINGYLFPQNDGLAFINAILKLYLNSSLREQMGVRGRKKAMEFTIENSLKSMLKIYNKFLI
jgi:glycosyltransferase EpsD